MGSMRPALSIKPPSLLLGTCLLLLSSSCDQPNGRPLYLTDAQGREMVLHGVNVSGAAKSDPLGLAWHTKADYARLAGWGFNTVRLLLFWSVLEPIQGQYNSVYMDSIEERLDWAEAHGLMVILDMHQDLYSAEFTGDGAPAWAINSDGHRFSPLSPWWLNYIHPAVLAAFDHLWTDAWLQDAYADAWGHVASHLGSHSAVVGYDLMNEPFLATQSPLTFEGDRLRPFYHLIAQSIRIHDPDARIFFEPMAFPTASGAPSLMPAYGDPQAAYAPHYYDPIVHEGGQYHGNAAIVDAAIALKASEAEDHGVPMILGEFGAFGDGPGHLDYLEDMMDALDQHACGWAYWSYDKGGGFGILDNNGDETDVFDVIVRAYPQRVAGTIQEHSFNLSTRVMELRYETPSSITAPTEIFVPAARLYPGGFQVSSSDAAGSWSWTFDQAREVVQVVHDTGQNSHTIRIEP